MLFVGIDQVHFIELLLPFEVTKRLPDLIYLFLPVQLHIALFAPFYSARLPIL